MSELGREAPLARTARSARPAVGRLLLGTALGAIAMGAAIGLIATSAWLISRSSQHPPQSAVALAIAGVQFFALSRAIFRYGERLVGHDAAFRVLADLRARVYGHLERLAPLGLPVFRSGDLLARLVADVDSMEDLLLRVVPPFAIAALVGTVTVVLVWSMLPAAGVILLIALVIAGTLVPWLASGLAARAEGNQASARGALGATVVDLLDGAPELVVNGATDAHLRRAARADAELTRVASASARTAGVGKGLGVLCMGLAMWGMLVVGVAAVHAHRMSGVLLAVIALVPVAAFELVAGLPTATQILHRVRRSAARVFEVLDASQPVVDPRTPARIGPGPHSLEVRALRVRYPDGTRWALDGVDLQLSPGRRVALVGPSGAGKSTLAAALLRFLPYEAGSVKLDGTEIAELNADEYRGVIGLVAQDAHVFDSTLEQNLRLARRDATTDELRAALEAVELLSWADTLPAGLQTELGERGRRISGGQRQRLAIARALLADFPLLVLDEPWQHLDPGTADAIFADVLAATHERATLLITHRLAGLAAVDEILVLERGCLVERGTHAELIAGSGRYAKLWRREIQLGRVCALPPDAGGHTCPDASAMIRLPSRRIGPSSKGALSE